MVTHQAETQHEKRECGAVVESCLSREREAKPVAIAGFRHLNIRGKYGVGWGEHRPEEHCGAEALSQSVVPREGDEADGDHHGQNRERQRQPPDRITQWHAQLQACGK